MASGPFDVSADQILGLRTRFTAFVNKLLAAEAARHGVAGYKLRITANETAADGGVDAHIEDVPEGSNWIPAGASAVQFKRGSQSAAECASELSKDSAELARDVLAAGGSYVILLGGQSLPHESLLERETAIRQVALENGLVGPGDESGRIRVYAADQLARWASEFPSLAIDELIGGPRLGAVSHARWRLSQTQRFTFVADETRRTQIEDLRRRMLSNELSELRLQGDNGVGKTRLALELLDDPTLSPLVAYIASASEITAGLVESMLAPDRSVILVIDECPADRHLSYASRLSSDPRMKLLTIGDIGASRSSGPAVKVTALAKNDVDSLLVNDFPALWPEARRFVCDYSLGNPGMAIWLAQTVVNTDRQDAVELIERDDIVAFITRYLPEGADFFSVAVLALFERVGWDRELRVQMELVADFVGTAPTTLDRLVQNLAARNLVVTQGRYRAVDPLPLAVYLAGEAWRHYGPRIVGDLLPRLPDDLALAFYRRLADLGRFRPATDAVGQLLSNSGPFGSLELIEAEGRSAALTPLAVVLPDEMARHLSILIDQADLEELRGFTGMRRNLVWTLEKLVWHTRTFELAASALLRLALAENESWANNATGTWLELFGSRLPATAARPEQRAEYLEKVANDARAQVRTLAASAAAKGLQGHEWVSVSGEIQGGVLVEPRGSAFTWDEDGTYRTKMIRILSRLAADGSADVSRNAAKALLGAMYAVLPDPLAGPILADALLSLPEANLRSLRIEVARVLALSERARSGTQPEDQGMVQAIRQLQQRLPEAPADEKLATLVRSRGFTRERDRLQAEMSGLLSQLTDEQTEQVILGLDDNHPASFELGTVIAIGGRDSKPIVAALTERYEASPGGLLGLLHARVVGGDQNAFDAFLSGPLAKSLPISTQLSIAARGPETDAALERVSKLAHEVDVQTAASTMYPWRPRDSSYVAKILNDWLKRLDSQDDYDAAVNWTSVGLPDDAVPSQLAEVVWSLIERRRDYPALGHASWEWSQLATRLVDTNGRRAIALLLDLMENDLVIFGDSSEEVHLFQAAAAADPASVWSAIAGRLEGPESWRVVIQLKDWVQFAIPVQVIADWVDHSIDRARIVAELTTPGEAVPTELARMLLSDFPNDDLIWASLRASLVSGVWSGPWSARVQSQIEHLTAWAHMPELEVPVRAWAHDVVVRLQAELISIKEFEAERDF